MGAYRPIPCALHDRYERAVITRAPLTLRWYEGAHTHTDTVRALALATEQGEEFLSFEDSAGATHHVRLDAIRLIA